MAFRKKNEQTQNEDSTKYSFGELVREHRVKKHLTFKDLGLLTGIDPSYLSRLETGVRDTPSVPIFLTICDALNIDLIAGLHAFGSTK